MKLAIVGSRSLAARPDALDAVKRVVDRLQPTLIISGGAQGVDAFAEEVAGDLDIAFVEFLPENRRWEPDGYKARNMKIAKACDYCVNIMDRNTKTFGGRWTRTYAAKIGKTTEEIIL